MRERMSCVEYEKSKPREMVTVRYGEGKIRERDNEKWEKEMDRYGE